MGDAGGMVEDQARAQARRLPASEGARRVVGRAAVQAGQARAPAPVSVSVGILNDRNRPSSILHDR
jgi:hypothetical protein